MKKIRISKKIKQIDLAYKCVFDRQNMYHMEAGRNNLTLLTLRKLAKALEVEIPDLTDL
ncbi:MAG: helix-turn-helix transcriptional regulator [Bacteroidota bacterium]|nr:helix-turn-helix transcriptional regulator [Bacteroidota bacterium]